MKKLLFTMLALLLLTSSCTPANAKDKEVTIKVSTLEAIKLKLERLEAIETAKPEVKISGVKVVVDQEGRVFVSDSASVQLKLAMLDFTGEIKLNANVFMYPQKEDNILHISRFGLLSAGEQAEAKNYSKIDRGAVYLTYRAFEYRRLTFEGIVNTKRYGLGLGYKITPNTKIIGGVNFRFSDTVKGNAKIFLGAGFNF